MTTVSVPLLTLFNWSTGELLIILVVLLLLFGNRMAKAAGGLGSSIREFKKGLSGEEKLPDNSKDADRTGASSRDRENTGGR